MTASPKESFLCFGKLCLTNVKDGGAVMKRIKSLVSNENTPESVNEWMKNVKNGKMEIVPNEILKAGAKAQNEKITVRKNEVNRVIKK